MLTTVTGGNGKIVASLNHDPFSAAPIRTSSSDAVVQPLLDGIVTSSLDGVSSDTIWQPFVIWSIV